MPKRVIILGGGVSGLTLGWRLALKGVEVELLESAASVGGLAGTVREDGYCLDYGPHSFFTEDTEMLRAFHDLFGNSLDPLTRRVKFNYRGNYLDYPFTPASLLIQMGFIAGLRSALSFLRQKLMWKKTIASAADISVEDWAISSFGNHLYRTFFKPYTEQFWKIKCSELSARSIPSHTRTSFLNTLKALLNRKVTREGSSLMERERLPTFYPATGYGELTDHIADEMRKAGGKILTGSRALSVHKITGDTWEVKYLNQGEEKSATGHKIVSTVPLPFFIGMLHPKPPREVCLSAERLDFRPLVVLGMITEKQNILGEAMYMYQLDKPYNRIFEANKFSRATSPEGENILAAEFTCQRDSVVWNASKEELFDMCIGSLTEDGFLSPGDVKKLMLVKAPYAYPIYRKNYADHLKRVLSFIHREQGLDTLGRSGEFMYMDADRCMRRAFDFSERFLKEKEQHDTGSKRDSTHF